MVATVKIGVVATERDTALHTAHILVCICTCMYELYICYKNVNLQKNCNKITNKPTAAEKMSGMLTGKITETKLTLNPPEV
jgi:hypothetical protein